MYKYVSKKHLFENTMCTCGAGAELQGRGSRRTRDAKKVCP